MAWTNLNSEDVGIKVKGTPAVSSWKEGRLDVFIRSLDNRLFHRVFENETWQGANWRDLSDGHTFETSPAAVSWSPDRIDLFAVWNRQVQHRACQGSAWGRMERLGKCWRSAHDPDERAGRGGNGSQSGRLFRARLK